MKTSRAFRCLFALLCTAASLTAADWPQYRGPNHDGSSPEKILKTWPAEGPKVIWKAPLGPSFGSFAVSGGKAFCFIQRKVDGADKEVAIALDANTGKELWSVPLGKPTYDQQGGDGPRSTPTVDGDRVYLFGAFQILTCLDAASGKQIWQHDLVAEFGGKVIKWNSAASPVVEGDLVIVNGGGPGQAFLAFNKSDGKVVWKTEDDAPVHATPTPATILGTRQILFLTQKGVAALAPADGRVLWRYLFPHRVSTATSPIVAGDIVYCSAAYGVGAAAVRIAKTTNEFSATELWRKNGDLMTHWTTPVCKDGYLYGIYGQGQNATAPLKCVELATGKELWSQPGFGGGGATILVDGCVLAQSDRGPLILVEAKPDAYHELARAQIYGGQCWTMPVVSNGKIFARNTKEGFCLDAATAK
ncbi:MAG: alcohol dehydrogenase [Verrucomicrobia bacterium]|nr:MAG: alcohol dehydrogenase [Verrucomicrobiota bacterium]